MLEFLGDKPWFVWNNTLITNDDEVQGIETFQDVLYGSQVSPVPKIKRFPSDWNRETVLDDLPVPTITSVAMTGVGESSPGTGGIGTGYQTCYLFIPVNERGEAGTWYYMPFDNGGAIDSTQLPTTSNDLSPEFTLTVNKATSYVEIWKTRQRSVVDITDFPTDTTFYFIDSAQRNTLITTEQAITARPGAVQQTSVPPEVPTNYYLTNTDIIYLKDTTNSGSLYNEAQLWIGRILVFDDVAVPGGSVIIGKNYRIVDVSQDSSDPLGTVSVRLVDHDTGLPVEFNYNHIHPLVIGVIDEPPYFAYIIESETHSSVTIVQDEVTGFDQVRFTDDLFLSNVNDDFSSDGVVILDRTPNVHSHWIQLSVNDSTGYPTLQSATAYKMPGARVLYNSSGVMMWGNVKYATKPPALFHFQREFSGLVGKRILLQLEYHTSSGNVYGPVMQLDDVVFFSIKAQDESALIVYGEAVDDSGDWKLYERITASSNGLYVSDYSGNKKWTWQIAGYDVDILDNDEFVSVQPVTEYISEPKTILLSKIDSPAEITISGATTVSGQSEVMAITPARLAEEEGIRNYEAYVFTGDNVFIIQREAETVAFDTVTSSFGLYLSNTYVLTKNGICFFGSDKNLHFLSGRQLSDPPLNDKVKTLFDIVYDMAYDVVKDEVWCLSDTGIWIYSLRYAAWIANYDYTNEDYDIIFYYPNSDVIARDADTKLPYVFKNRGDWLSSGVTTNRTFDGPVKSKIEQLEIDFDVSKSNTGFSVSSGSPTVTITSSLGDLFDLTLDVGALVIVPGAGTDGKAMKAQIVSMSSTTECTLDRNAVTTASSGTLKWTPTIEVDHSVRSSDIVHTFKVFQRRPVYPRLRGTGHQLEVKNFREIREIFYNIEQSPGVN